MVKAALLEKRDISRFGREREISRTIEGTHKILLESVLE